MRNNPLVLRRISALGKDTVILAKNLNIAMFKVQIHAANIIFR